MKMRVYIKPYLCWRVNIAASLISRVSRRIILFQKVINSFFSFASNKFARLQQQIAFSLAIIVVHIERLSKNFDVQLEISCLCSDSIFLGFSFIA